MYEPCQKQDGGSGPYDPGALTGAASAALRPKAQEHPLSSSEAVEDVMRAVRVAELLGLRLVGWCLSHDKVTDLTR